MRASTLPSCCRLAALALFVAPAWASPPPSGDLVVECDPIRLPSQISIARATGLHNIGQAYAARTRLMARVRQECQREGVSRVRLVQAGDPDVARPLAGR